ncbi:MAG: alpha/beta hydrolase [Deltaproteobacteria bacterium]|nr:alpha/beta hydrolase [Deltaproteobacteria bacterium]
MKPIKKFTEIPLIKDPWYNYQLIRVMETIYTRQADVGECLQTALEIIPGDDLSWYQAWFKTADRVFNIGQTSEKGGHKISAGEAYLRASNYYRTAQFFMHADPNDPRALGAARSSVQSFVQAMKLLSVPVESVKIPYERTTLPGYFYTSPRAPKPGPLLIVWDGFDGTAEEIYYVGDAAIRRGYHCLIIEGPGQGKVIRGQNLTFRPEAEKVLIPVVDYVLTRPEVDRLRIALEGISFGGYFCSRAAAFEHRIKLLILNAAIYDFYELFMGRFPSNISELYKTDKNAFNAAIINLGQKITSFRWFFNDAYWKFGLKTPTEVIDKTVEFNNRGYVGKIKARTLLMEGEADALGQTKKMYQDMTCTKEIQRMFDWIDQHI